MVRTIPATVFILTLAMAIAGCSSGNMSPVATNSPAAEPLELPPVQAQMPAARPNPTATATNPTFVGDAPAARADSDPAGSATTFTRFNGAISIWGEVPGRSNAAPTDASGNLRQISFTREGADFDLDIHPAGKFLIYASTRHRHTADIYMKNVDGNTVTQLTNDPANDVMPAISPDGKSFAFASDRGGSWDIYIQNVAGGQPIQITSSPAQELHPSWSPDGRTLIFSSLGHKSEGQWEMVVVDVANPAKRRFIGFGLFPKFSPDGAKIVFQKARFRGTRLFSVWTIDFVNGEGQRPTEIAAATNAAVVSPTWSPDGKRLAFATVVNPATDPTAKPTASDLWVINLDGTGRVKLTNDQYANLQPVWAADNTIYFVSNRTGYENVWSVRPTRNVQVAGQPDENAPVRSAEVPTP